jgi:hypothetical protein
MNIALLVKVSDQEWEVVSKHNLPKPRFDILSEAYKNGRAITGMKTSSYKETVLRGSIWNGTSFSGGENFGFPEGDEDWDLIGTYSILIDNVVFMRFINVKNDAGYDKMEAAFSSEVTMIPIESGQPVRLGSIWNGQEFITKD